MPHWQDKEYMSAEEARAAASRHKRLADAARADNDKGFESYHRQEAREYREIARNKEIK